MSTNTFTISVITVCFNSALTIERCLQSVASQDLPNVQHIVIDGASTDTTLDILKSYRAHLSHFVSEPDNGIYDAMNKGLDLASGDIVCFLNADDQYADKSVLSRIAQQMKDHQLDALLGDVAFFHEKDPTRMIRRYRSDRFTPERLAWGWMPSHPGLFLKREIVEKVGRFKTDYRIAGDYEYVVRAFYGQNLHYEHMPRVLVHMQTGGASSQNWRARVLLNQEVLRACKENGVSTNILKILSKYPAKLLELLQA